MITNFEEFTGELTEYDAEKVLPLLDYYISTVARGKDNSITNARLVELCASEGVKTSGPRVRKIIHEIRVRGIINNLLATSKGYYVSDDPDEVDVYIKSCKERISSIWEIVHALEKQKHGQMNFDNVKPEGYLPSLNNAICQK